MYSTVDSHKGQVEEKGTKDSTALRGEQIEMEQGWLNSSPVME
jgi:hypothetical protein